MKRTSDDSGTIHADLSLLYERPLQYSTIVDFKEVIPHRVTIDKSSGKIIKSERLDMEWQIANAVSDQTAAGLVPGVGSDYAEPLVVRPMTTAETSKVSNVRSSACTVGRGVMPSGISSATAVNRTNAINYARAWWNKRNGAYTGYPVYCTAFVSQAMRAGGWHWVNYGNNHTADSAWWDRNNLLIPRASYTYGGAENFFRFGRNSSQRLFPVTQVSQLMPGDILQYKVKGSDALMDHTMIVTKKVGSEVFLTYHTTDTLDKPFSQMSSSNVEWYAHGHR